MITETVKRIDSRNTLRNSSIECLRILSMVMITFHHFAVHGEFEWNVNAVTIPHAWYNLMQMGGKIGVVIFILITGYFMIEKKDGFFNFKKILKFWGPVFFYSVGIYLLFCGLGLCKMDLRSLRKACLPILYSKYWFATTYFMLFLLHPFLNRLLTGLDKYSYQKLLVILVLCWSVVPTFTMQPLEGDYLTWFITFYAIGGYVKLYGFNPSLTSGHYFILWAFFSTITYLTSVVIMAATPQHPKLLDYITYFFDQQTLTVLLTGLSLFMAFEKLKMKYHKWINVMASAAFGVYLVHDNELFSTVLWTEIFKNARYQNSLTLIPYSILVVTMVYIACTFVDLIRQKIVHKPYIVLVDRYAESLLIPFKWGWGALKAVAFGKENHISRE